MVGLEIGERWRLFVSLGPCWSPAGLRALLVTPAACCWARVASERTDRQGRVGPRRAVGLVGSVGYQVARRGQWGGAREGQGKAAKGPGDGPKRQSSPTRETHISGIWAIRAAERRQGPPEARRCWGSRAAAARSFGAFGALIVILAGVCLCPSPTRRPATACCCFAASVAPVHP